MTELLKRRRVALLAGLAVAALVFMVLRRRGGGGETGTLLAPASGTAPEQTLDAGAAAVENLFPAVADLTSYTYLLESRLGQIETTNESIAGKLDDLIDDRLAAPPAAAPNAAGAAPVWTPPPTRAELLARSQAANPHATFGPSPIVRYPTVEEQQQARFFEAPRAVRLGASGQQPPPAPGNARIVEQQPPAPAVLVRAVAGAGRHVAA